MSGSGRIDHEALDRMALFDLSAAYARLVDRRDFVAVEALFVPGGRLLRYDGHERVGEPATDRLADGTLAELLRANLERYSVTTHFLGQQTADIHGDEASTETYCFAHHIYEQAGEHLDRIMSIRYLDRCARVEGAWRFEERCLLVDWTEVRPLRRM